MRRRDELLTVGWSIAGGSIAEGGVNRFSLAFASILALFPIHSKQ